MAFTLGKTKEKKLIPLNGKLVSDEALTLELNKLKVESANFDKEYGKCDSRSIAKLGEVEDKIAELEDISKLLDTRTAFVNESVHRLHLTAKRFFVWISLRENLFRRK